VRKYSDNADAYTDPKTGILKNKLGLTTEKKLERVEAEISALRSQELAHSPIAGNFDLSHLKAIHKKLFSDVYPWAGQIRTVDISKGDSRFAHHGRIEAEAKKLTDQLNREQNLRGLSAERFSQRAGYYMGELNVIHPFREGNGRTLREYIGQIAKEAGYEIRWGGIDRKDMTQASIEAYQGSSERMARLIRENLVDRDRQQALQRASDGLGKPDADIREPQQGQKYTGKVLAVIDRHVAQVNDKTADQQGGMLPSAAQTQGQQQVKSGAQALAEGGISLLGGAAALTGAELKAGGKVASLLAGALRERNGNEAQQAPAAGVVVLPRISEFRIGYAEKTANAYQDAMQKLWASGNLPNVLKEIEERARQIGWTERLAAGRASTFEGKRNC